MDYGIETQSSIVLSDSIYSTSDGRWTHIFYEGAHSVTKRKRTYESDSAYGLYPNVNGHSVTVENTDSNTSLLITTSSNDIGAAPAEDGFTGSNAYADAAWTLMKFALSAESPVFGVGTVALDITDALLPDSNQKYGQSQEYQWNYSPSFPCEAAHHASWVIRTNQDYAKANFKVYEWAVADAGGVYNSMTWTIHVDPFNGGIQSVGGPTRGASTNSTSIESQYPQTKEETLQVLESSDTFEKVAPENVKEEKVKEVAKGEPIYRAVNPSISASVEPTAPEEYRPN